VKLGALGRGTGAFFAFCCIWQGIMGDCAVLKNVESRNIIEYVWKNADLYHVEKGL
jgi:hypothetical protein